MRALVTGGGGFIGSNLVDALVERGDEVTVVDDFSTGRREYLERATAGGAAVHELDIRDARRLGELVVRARPDVVFHLAAQIDVRRSVADPRLDADVNVAGTIAVLEAARGAGVSRFVYSSTGGALYGETDRIPSPEDTPVRPLAPYGHSKFAGEGYCDLYARLHGLSAVSLRYANVYGPRQDPLGEGGVVAIFSGKLAQRERPTVFGDGRQTRDFTFVGDVVAANLAAGDSDATGAYNVGTGRETSVLELVEAFRELDPGASFEPEFAPERPGEVFRSCLDPSLAAERLGWRAGVELGDGLRWTFASLGPTARPG